MKRAPNTKKNGSERVGIIGYGAALPKECVLAEEIERGQGLEQSGIPQSLMVKQKTVPAKDEDTATLAVAASWQALDRFSGESKKIGALFVGSESHPYAVKPTGTIIASALGLSEQLAMADLQFACKAGTQSVQIGYSYVKSGLAAAALAVGADTAQARPGDVLEFTAGAGAAAYIIGTDQPHQPVLVEILDTVSVATDTPDFWRRPGQPYPEHAGRFSGEPAYFSHISKSTNTLLDKQNITASDIDFCVFHTPNGKFPRAIAKKLGFSSSQLAPSLVVDQIGNTYAAASLLALAALLDQVEANRTILMASYGSGAGSDAFLLKTTPALLEQRALWANFLSEQISRLQPLSYTQLASRGAH